VVVGAVQGKISMLLGTSCILLDWNRRMMCTWVLCKFGIIAILPELQMISEGSFKVLYKVY
jgi:hypothetical protein